MGLFFFIAGYFVPGPCDKKGVARFLRDRLFILGIVAYRQNWLAILPLRFGRFWFRLALILGIPLWFVITILGNAPKSPLPFFGGLHWQAAAYAVWESFFCIGICLGLLVIYREKYNTQGPVSRFLSKNYFGVYVFHPPIMVGITQYHI